MVIFEFYNAGFKGSLYPYLQYLVSYILTKESERLYSRGPNWSNNPSGRKMSMVRGKELRRILANGMVKVATTICAVLAGIAAIVTFALGEEPIIAIILLLVTLVLGILRLAAET